MSDDGEWIDGAMLDDWRDRDEAKSARITELEAENARLRDALRDIRNTPYEYPEYARSVASDTLQETDT